METGSSGAKSSTEVEVVAKAERRRFTAEYKLKVVREAEDCQRPGEIGALLGREGLYWANLTHWRKQRESGEVAGLRAKRRGLRHQERNRLAHLGGEFDGGKARGKRRAERRVRRGGAVNN